MKGFEKVTYQPYHDNIFLPDGKITGWIYNKMTMMIVVMVTTMRIMWWPDEKMTLTMIMPCTDLMGVLHVSTAVLMHKNNWYRLMTMIWWVWILLMFAIILFIIWHSLTNWNKLQPKELDIDEDSSCNRNMTQSTLHPLYWKGSCYECFIHFHNFAGTFIPEPELLLIPWNWSQKANTHQGGQCPLFGSAK